MRVGVIKSGMKFATFVAVFELHVSCQIISGRVQIARPLQGPSGPPRPPPRAPEGAQIPRQKKKRDRDWSKRRVGCTATHKFAARVQIHLPQLGAKVTKKLVARTILGPHQSIAYPSLLAFRSPRPVGFFQTVQPFARLKPLDAPPRPVSRTQSPLQYGHLILQHSATAPDPSNLLPLLISAAVQLPTQPPCADLVAHFSSSTRHIPRFLVAWRPCCRRALFASAVRIPPTYQTIDNTCRARTASHGCSHLLASCHRPKGDAVDEDGRWIVEDQNTTLAKDGP